MDVDDIITQALDPLGGEYTSGAEAERARRILNLLLIELQNKNIPLNKIQTDSVPLIDGTASYTLDADIVDVLKLTLKNVDNSNETTLDRWSMKEYHELPNKTTEGRPTLYSTLRQNNQVNVRFWPVPNQTSEWTAELLVSKRVEDITASYQKIDLPHRYLPLLVKWLSYELSLTRQGVAAEMIAHLKQRLDEVMPDTFEEDRERVDFVIQPGHISGF